MDIQTAALDSLRRFRDIDNPRESRLGAPVLLEINSFGFDRIVPEARVEEGVLQKKCYPGGIAQECRIWWSNPPEYETQVED